MTLYIGNVIRPPKEHGDWLWIVSAVHDYGVRPTVEAVCFNASNCSAVQRLDDHDDERQCACGDDEYQQGEPVSDCADCHGTGRYTKHVKGWKHSKVVAQCVEEFIMQGVKRSFKIKE